MTDAMIAMFDLLDSDPFYSDRMNYLFISHQFSVPDRMRLLIPTLTYPVEMCGSFLLFLPAYMPNLLAYALMTIERPSRFFPSFQIEDEDDEVLLKSRNR